jgi:hypothetical protein
MARTETSGVNLPPNRFGTATGLAAAPRQAHHGEKAHEGVRPMGTTDVLRRSVRHTHEDLAELFHTARAMESPTDRPREAYESIDRFLATASKHLHAVDAVLLAAVRRRVTGGRALVHDYVHAVKALEVVLAHAKANEYGSAYERTHAWAPMWADVEAALAAQQRQERALCDRLVEALGDAELDRLAQRLHDAELAAPSRPHPYTPHTGLPGLVARKVMHTADLFWDSVEGRMVPEPERVPKKSPGLIAQYFLADPRFDEDDETLRDNRNTF